MENFTGLFFDRITAEDIRNHDFAERQIIFRVLRYDLADPLTGGNKWFKIYPFAEKAKREGKSTLLSFGGPYSNHIAALAAFARQKGFRSIGIIRGEEVQNKTLVRAEQDGMELHFISRSLYRELRELSFRHSYLETFGKDLLIIPEGGNAPEGQQGASLMYPFIPAATKHIILPSATGTTAAGIKQRLKPHQHLHVIQVLNNPEAIKFLEGENVSIYHGYTFGGYAKSSVELDKFCFRFMAEYGIPLEPIYSGKAMFAAFDLISRGNFQPGSEISFLHTGGLQYQNS